MSGGAGGVALLFPPLWYYGVVPADLSVPIGALREEGVDVRGWDLSAALQARLLGDCAGWQATRELAYYRDELLHRQARAEQDAAATAIAERHGLSYHLRRLRFLGVDEAHVPEARRAGLDPSRNPALPLLMEAAEEVVAAHPAVVGVALVYPDQRVQALALGRLLRRAGLRAPLLLFGGLEDPMSPGDLAPDLLGEPLHQLFEDYDGAVLGEAWPPLLALARGLPPPLPGLLWRGQPAPPAPAAPTRPADFGWVQPAHYSSPRPVVDLRLGRGCAWGRCAFCAIPAQQGAFAAGSVEALARSAERAWKQLGSDHLRLRDDLLTPPQLRAVATALGGLPRRPRWSARMRFEAALGPALLREAAAAGLDELWMGLESADPALRQRMDKGVDDAVVERLLEEVPAAGVGLRLLCLLGFPGERDPGRTLDLLLARQDRLVGASLSPFELTRRSPMAARPADWGLRCLPDPLPRSARLRHTLGWRHLPGQGPTADWRPAFLERRLALEALLGRDLAPDVHHGWWRRGAQGGALGPG